MIRRALLALGLTGLVVVSGAGVAGADAPATNFVAHLTGAQETPPTGSTATGTLTLSLSDNGNRIHFRLRANGVTRIQQAHIHVGDAGEPGPIVVFFFAKTPNTADSAITGDGFEVAGVRTPADFNFSALGATFTYADFLNKLRSGGTYVNVHSPTFPGGEIRGQIQPSGDEGED